VTASCFRNRGSLGRRLAEGPGKPLVLVHGDTMTTVLGALLGRLLGVPVAHIEGGLRSHDLRHPFPEELNRRLASRLSRIDYAPGRWAASNLHGDVVDTGTNTIRDSLELVPPGEPVFGLPEEPFGIVSLHRFELLNNRRLLGDTIELLATAALRTPMFFIDHPVTIAALERFGLQRPFDDKRFVRIPRMRFFDFVRAQRQCSFVVTDSGGSQEECFYLDLPCLVHRVKTERREGLGENAVLSGMRTDVLRDFLADPGRFHRRSALPEGSPSQVIVDDLVRRGFAVEENDRGSPARG
jgi:UDP-N-acetylglucosamine 2-epimerase (non-hydrolysing)